MENLEDVECGQLGRLDVPEGTGQLVLPEVVLREIFENLSSADCLRLSLVNKAWHYEAQNVLQDRGSFTAKMNTDDGRCKDLRVFASDLRRMKELRKVIPFSGLTISTSGVDAQHGHWCEESSVGELDEIYDDILRQINWKHLALALDFSGIHRSVKENCAGFQLAKKILHNRSCSLEELSLKIGFNREAFIQHFLQDCNFSSRLKTLKFEGSVYGGDENLIKALVSRAPNLEVLYTIGRGHVNVYANLLEGSSAEHVLDSPFRVRENARVPESIAGRLRLRQLYIHHSDLERLRMITMLLRNSQTTLNFMEVDALVLVRFMQYGICLKNVRTLRVWLPDSDVFQPHSRRLLKSFDFTRIFPNLRSVHISNNINNDPDRGHSWNAVNDILHQGNAAFIEPVNRTINIKKLCLYSANPRIPDAYNRFLVEVFPHIDNLSIRSQVLFVHFWDYWLDLEEVYIMLLIMPEVIENLDSVLCGIFPEEVVELRERDEEYLRCVNIVPVMPSLSSLKRLRNLKIWFYELDVENIDLMSIISKVTGFIAFKRCPDLFVTLATNSDRWRQELQHLEPYASVQLTR